MMKVRLPHPDESAFDKYLLTLMFWYLVNFKTQGLSRLYVYVPNNFTESILQNNSHARTYIPPKYF